jgi:hypothetical protein
MWTISSVRSSLAPTGISVSARLLTGKMHPTTYEAEFPIWDRRSRILPLSRPGHNEFATNLATKQAREEMTMFAPTGFAPQAGVEHQYLSAGSSRLCAKANTKSYGDTFLLGWQTADRSHNRQLEEKVGKAL